MDARYAEHPPCPALRAAVACYWSLEATGAGGHRVLPDGCMDVLFDATGRASIVGTMTTAIAVPHVPRSRVFGVRFRPGEAFAFLRVPASEARDGMIPLADALGRLGDELRDLVLASPSDAARVAALDRALVRLRARPPDARVRRAVARIFSSPAEARVAWLAGDLGIGERQLERTFEERVGIGPKALARVARLQALVTRITRGAASPSWAPLAAEVGYADQAHLAREVKRLAGVTPSELAREAGRGEAWPIAL